MRLPELLFRVINPTVTLLLRSPLHRVCSGSLMLVGFTGRRSGRHYTTPVRYLRDGDVIRCFTSTETRWWRNLRGGAACSVTVRGQVIACRATVIENDPERARPLLLHYLSRFPQDAAYYAIGLGADGDPDATDLASALPELVVVEASPAD